MVRMVYVRMEAVYAIFKNVKVMVKVVKVLVQIVKNKHNGLSGLSNCLI